LHHPIASVDRTGEYRLFEPLTDRRIPMTTFAPNQDTRDERTREAWSAYRDGLVELQGAQYDTAETESWDRLQDALNSIEEDRAALSTGGDPHT
jgi:hypothetical protein